MNILLHSAYWARKVTPLLSQRRSAPFLPGLKARGILARFW